MSISAVCSNSSFAQSDSTSVMNQWKQDFRQLASALQSGNLAGAQKAFKALQQLQQSNPSGGQSSNGQSASSGNSPIQNDFAALGQALSSGNLSAAQGDFSQLQSAMQAAGANGASGGAQSAHHGHHHRHVSSGTDSDNSAGGATSSTGSNLDIYA